MSSPPAAIDELRTRLAALNYYLSLHGNEKLLVGIVLDPAGFSLDKLHGVMTDQDLARTLAKLMVQSRWGTWGPASDRAKLKSKVDNMVRVLGDNFISQLKNEIPEFAQTYDLYHSPPPKI